MARHIDESSGFVRRRGHSSTAEDLEALCAPGAPICREMLPVARALEAALVTGDDGGAAWRSGWASCAR